MLSPSAMNLNELLWVVLLGSGFGPSLGVPPQDFDPMLAKLAPPQCVYYTSWAGMSEPDPTTGNNTERLLADPEVKSLIHQIQECVQRVQSEVAESAGSSGRVIGQYLPLFQRVLFTHATAVFLENASPQPDGIGIRGAMVVNLGDELPQVEEALKSLWQAVSPEALEQITIGKILCMRVRSQSPSWVFTIGIHKQYLIIAVGDAAFEGVLARATNAPPNWLNEAMAEAELPPRLSTFTYINLEAVTELTKSVRGPRVQAVLDALGSSAVKRVVSVTGLDDTGFVSRTRLFTDTAGGGLLELLSQAVPFFCRNG